MSALGLSQLSLDRGGKRVVDGVSLTVGVGEIVALLGANGAGKSSLVLGVSGLLPLASGVISAEGRDLTGAPPYVVRAAGIAAVPEGHQVLASLSVADNLKVAGAHLNPAATAEGLARAYDIFPELATRKNQPAGSLSGGQQQMVVLAQAIVGRPRVILADEMSLGLAPLIVKRLLEVVRVLAAEGVGVLLIEQFTHLALGLASRAYVMERGRIVFSGTPAEIEADPEILRAAYLSAG